MNEIDREENPATCRTQWKLALSSRVISHWLYLVAVNRNTNIISAGKIPVPLKVRQAKSKLSNNKK